MLEQLQYRLPQSVSLFQALRLSYGVQASRSGAAQARRLAPSARCVAPGVFQVGESQVNLWRRSCTCKAQRLANLADRPFRPCVHFLALYIAGEWSPLFNGTLYLASVNVTPPAALQVNCRVRGLWGTYLVKGTYRLQDGSLWVSLRDELGRVRACAYADIHHVVTLYEEA